MQFISEDPVRIVVRSELPALHDGKGKRVRDRQRRLYAQFRRGGLPPFALELAVKTWKFNKKPPEHPIENWPGFYDSEADQLQNNWTDAERKVIEDKLTVGLTDDDGRFHPPPHGLLLVERPQLPAPWPAYDKLVAQGARTVEKVAQKIAEKVIEDGYDPALVVAYERENLNRPEVLDALAHLTAEPVAEGEELVSA